LQRRKEKRKRKKGETILVKLPFSVLFGVWLYS